MKVLDVGGAGYIGSHMAKQLGQLVCQLSTLADLSSGIDDAVLNSDSVQGSFADADLSNRLLKVC
jgi:UDP-glucose 4-epimerase